MEKHWLKHTKVLVTGQCPIGILAAQLCKLGGAYQVIVTDLCDRRLDVAGQVGVDLTLNPGKDDVLARIQEFTEGRGTDVVVESSKGGTSIMRIGFYRNFPDPDFEHALKLYREMGVDEIDILE